MLERKAAGCWPPNPDSSADHGTIPRHTGTLAGYMHVFTPTFRTTNQPFVKGPIDSEWFSAEEEKRKLKRQRKSEECLVLRHQLLPGNQYSVWYPDNSVLFWAFLIFYDKLSATDN